MNKKFRGIYLSVSFAIITLFHLPYAFAKSATGNSLFHLFKKDTTTKKNNEPVANFRVLTSVYDSLKLNLKGLSQEAFDFANDGFTKLVNEGKLMNDSIISIIDFSLPSNKKRLFIIDLKNYKILFNTFVAHGRNTGRETAIFFSNQNSTYKSSPGFYITRQTYFGKNGYSLKLEGIERGINDKAFERGIVIHGANYVSEAIANVQGYIGRSQGCPAVPVKESGPIINTIKEGSCLFIYHSSYIGKSSILS